MLSSVTTSMSDMLVPIKIRNIMVDLFPIYITHFLKVEGQVIAKKR